MIANVVLLNFCVFHYMNVCTFFPLAGIFWRLLAVLLLQSIYINTKYVHRRMSEWDTTYTRDLGFMCSPR